jgi:hypothetical protein
MNQKNSQYLNAGGAQGDRATGAICAASFADFQVAVLADGIRRWVGVFPAQLAAFGFREFLETTKSRKDIEGIGMNSHLPSCQSSNH